MRFFKKPLYDAVEILKLCANSYEQARTEGLKNRLLASEADIHNAAAAYESAASSTLLHTLPQMKAVGGPGTATQADMSRVYDRKMASADGPARHIYDKLKSSSTHQKCPLCGSRIISELDHHLPKSAYPSYALLPINLVPSCIDCNKTKQTKAATCVQKAPIHPYYDDFYSETWLYAAVVKDDPPALTYRVVAPTSWDAVKEARAQNHLRTLQLDKYFSVEAGSMLTDIRHHLVGEFEHGGAAAVRSYLEAEAETRWMAHRNSWQAAAYAALASSDWFCAEGFKKVPKPLHH